MTDRYAETTFATARPARRRSALSSWLALLLLLAAAVPAAAQYREAGSELQAPPNRKDQLEKAMADAPWHFGKARVAPWIGLRSIDYVRELDAQGRQRPGDWTATGGAGLRAYLKLGTHAIAAAHAISEYSWWRKEQERNAPLGRYGLGLFGWGNRVEGELTARRDEDVTFLSSDQLVREPTRHEALAASAQVRVLGSIAVFGGATSDRTRIDATSGITAVDPALLLDRDASLVRGGLRYLLRGNRGYIGAGAFSERTEFQSGVGDAASSNKGSSWYAETQVRGNHIDVNLQYDHRDLESDDSAFPGYSAADGRALISLHPGWRLQYQLYGSRQLQYSARTLGTYIEEEREGAGVNLAIGRGHLQLFYETGGDDYFGTAVRHEDVTARGAWLDFPIRRINFRVGTRQTEFEPQGGPKRTLREALGAATLSFGGPGGDW